MPPNTIRVHTEYKLVKSVSPQVLWAVAAKTTGAGEYFLLLEFHAYIVEVVSSSLVKKSNQSKALATFIPSLREGHDNNNSTRDICLLRLNNKV
ncbi:hypothetical protein TNCV_2963011 [Trichonephila clavipes]|nr:hypothetical protein TNCV_2963011 [Trichonephila clavipes]